MRTDLTFRLERAASNTILQGDQALMREAASAFHMLSDPVAVHANMLRGTIAKPTADQIIHIYGRDALTRVMDAAKIEALQKEFPDV